LASIAASREKYEHIGAAPDAELIVVKLKKANQFFYNFYSVLESQENAFISIDIMLAIEYMIGKANELRMPISICIALGTNMSGHDGFTVMEEYITRVSQLEGVCICTAAGNESNMKLHASGIVATRNSTKDIQIRVPENAHSFPVFIWINPSDRMSVSIKSPVGETVSRAPAIFGTVTQTKLILERSTIAVHYFFPHQGSGAQFIGVNILDPTPGIWTITLFGDIILNGRFDAWLHMSGFLTPGIEFLVPDPYVTVTAPATSRGCIACGAYNDRDGSLYVNSSWGPTRIMTDNPDLVAPGVNVTGIYPTGVGIMTGTSVAAAITAGACSLMLQWGIVERNDTSLNTYRIKTYLIRGCSRNPNIQYPNPKWGYGKLNLFNTFTQMRP